MTLSELIEKLILLHNVTTKNYKITINGTHNWEYIEDIRIENNRLIIETKDIER